MRFIFQTYARDSVTFFKYTHDCFIGYISIARMIELLFKITFTLPFCQFTSSKTLGVFRKETRSLCCLQSKFELIF